MTRSFFSHFSLRARAFLLVLLISAGTLPGPVMAVTKTTPTIKAKVVTPAKKVAIVAPTAKLEISGWIPYWRTATGTADVLPHITSLTEVNPFGYTVKNNGDLYDALDIKAPEWQALKAKATANKVRFIPTVMWSSTEAIHAVLSDPKLRASHIKSITDAITQNGFDGVDIDYEGKSSDDKGNYTAFLKELSAQLGKGKMNKWLMCTIEAREPLTARYESGIPPSEIAYANDLPSINKYCDRVRIMTYDQQNADVQLNKSNKGVLYAPIADPLWVEKVVNYMAQDISKNKMVIGVATYGYEYQAISNVDGSGYTYTKLDVFNPKYGTDLAKQYGITPARNAAGELGFSYVPVTTSSELPSNSVLSALAPSGTSSANLAAAGALVYSKTQGKQAPIELLVWSDSVAIKNKIDLARKLGVKGVAIFKFDGGEDQTMWSVLK